MTVLHCFRVGLYALVCLATLGQWLGEEEAALPYPWLLILWAVAVYAFTDVWEKLVIPARLAPWLGLVAVAIFAQEEARTFTVNPVQPLGHLMVYFQVLLFVHLKKPGYRRYWFMLVVSFLQMMIAAVHNHDSMFGVLLIAYLAILVWTLNRFLLLRESERSSDFQSFPWSDPDRVPLDAPSARPASESQTPPVADVPWFRQVTGTLGASGLVLLGAAALFVLIPRHGQTAWRQPTRGAAPRVVGFDEQVRLGQMGTILDNGDEVMTVQLFDENGQPLRLAEEPLWRGVALQTYSNGRWERQPVVFAYPAPWRKERPSEIIRQEIRLQPVHPEVLFGLRPAYTGNTRDGKFLSVSEFDGILLRPDDTPYGPLHYTLESGREIDNQPKEIPDWRVAYEEAYREPWLQVPDELRDPLVDYVSRLVPPDMRDQEEIFRRLLTHLQNPRLFRYTLDDRPVDRGIDPVLDFLLNRHAGHCEYFASALALMLRARGLPARVVNGFKGGDWNELIGKSWVVRQRHAHSWVEAMLVKKDWAHWVPLDPTPGDARQLFVARQSMLPPAVRQVLDASRHVWSNYVLNFNAPEQEAVVYGPFRDLAVALPRMFSAAGQTLWSMPGGRVLVPILLLAFAILACQPPIRWLAARLSAAGPVVAKRAQGAGAGLFARLANWLRTLLPRSIWGRSAARRRIAFYEQLVQALAAHGVQKLPAWTHRQFAEHAGTALRQSPGTDSISVIPAELIDYFYRVRFGHHDLDPTESTEIDSKLRALRQAISPRDRRTS